MIFHELYQPSYFLFKVYIGCLLAESVVESEPMHIPNPLYVACTGRAVGGTD
jgi:hypothetical protein